MTLYCKCKTRSLLSECLKLGKEDEEDRVLECTDECIKNERNRKFAEALGITPRQQSYYRYSDFLMSYAKDYPSVCSKIEKAFSFLINSRETSHSFAAMSKEGRRFVHELAENYHLHSESYDPEPRRHVVVTKKQTTRIPPVLLSVSITQPVPAHWAQLNARVTKKDSNPQVTPSSSTASSGASKPETASLTSNNKNMPTEPTELRNAIHFFGLGSEVKSEHLTALLTDFEGKYHLKWIDEQNCLACFKPNAANWVHSALVKIQDNSAFHVKPYTGEPPIPEKSTPEETTIATNEGQNDNKNDLPPSEAQSAFIDSDFAVPKRVATPSSLSTTVPTWAQQMQSPANNRFSSLEEEVDPIEKKPVNNQPSFSKQQEEVSSLTQSTGDHSNLLGKSVDDWEDSILE